ncbi:MAG: 50S ribosomal protein L4 [Planctomycetes bacterium]|nr:50S ribosomal protein L4 [Planctomycetota bacterium]
MADLPLYDREGKRLGTVNIDESVFGDKVRKRLLHQVVVIYEANKRQGTASTKTRGEVEGSTRKPWPQKHTGLARAGTVRSPIWRHGGVVFGPRPRDYRLGLTAKMRRAALDSALLGKIRDQEVCVIEALGLPRPKTKHMASLLAAMELDRRVLIGVRSADPNVTLSVRNLPGVTVAPVSEFNAYDVVRHHRLLLTRDALAALLASRSKTKEVAAAATGSP